MRFEDYVDNDFDALVDRLPAGYDVEKDSDIFERMVDFLIDLEPEQLTENQLGILIDILEDMEITYEPLEDEIEEATIRRRRKRTKPSEKRERRQYYRRHRAQIKRKVKRYKKSAKGRRMKKLAKRMAKRGKTATGKRRTKFY